LCYPIKRIDSYPHALGGYNKMAQTLLEMTKDLTRSLVETGMLSAEDVPDSLQKTHATLTALKAQEEIGTTTVPVSQTLLVDWRKSITKHAVTCLDCGHAFKQLSIRHLRQHGLDARSYRTKYGIPQSQPLAARETTTRRRQIVRETRPWEKAPRYRKGQAQEGSEESGPEAEAVPEETEAPSAQAPAQPKRQRKTTPKKTARKTRSEG
jgi:predicted transcriptional regulator